MACIKDKLSPTQLVGIILIAAVVIIVFLLMRCYPGAVADAAKINPVNAPRVAIVVNTAELAEKYDLEAGGCGATDYAFKVHVFDYARKNYDFSAIRFFYGSKVGVHECVRYAVIFLR